MRNLQFATKPRVKTLMKEQLVVITDRKCAADNFMQKLFSNIRRKFYLVLGFVPLVVVVSTFSPETHAAEFEIGPTYTSRFNGGFGITFSERFAGKYDLGLSLISEQKWEAVHVSNNGNFWAAYVMHKPSRPWRVLPSEFSLGANHWFKNQSPINGCKVGYVLAFKYRFGNDFSIGWRHWSNGDSCVPNRGQDLMTFGWKF